MNCGLTIVLLTILIVLQISIKTKACNEAVCASIVSKCVLTEFCRCDVKNATCSRECFSCLSYLYSECCSCVELCPKPMETYDGLKHSQVGDLAEAMPDLFTALTSEPDPTERWSILTFPVDIDQSWFQPTLPTEPSLNAFVVGSTKIIVNPSKHFTTVNCTVVYIGKCMPMHKCKLSCGSLGASHFRWFHDGCCECTGQTCLNYGVNESRCSTCSLHGDEEGIEEDVSDQDQEKIEKS